VSLNPEARAVSGYVPRRTGRLLHRPETAGRPDGWERPRERRGGAGSCFHPVARSPV